MTCKHCLFARQPFNDEENDDVAGCIKQPSEDEHDAMSWYEGWYYAHVALGCKGDPSPTRGLLNHGYIYPLDTNCVHFSQK